MAASTTLLPTCEGWGTDKPVLVVLLLRALLLLLLLLHALLLLLLHALMLLPLAVSPESASRRASRKGQL
jgi:hypothetical protein